MYIDLSVIVFYGYTQYVTLLNDAPFRVMCHLMPITDTKVKQYLEKYTTRQTLKRNRL